MQVASGYKWDNLSAAHPNGRFRPEADYTVCSDSTAWACAINEPFDAGLVSVPQAHGGSVTARFEPTLNTLIKLPPWPIGRISLQLNRRLKRERASPEIMCATCSLLDWSELSSRS
jgi:hypothetical protein